MNLTVMRDGAEHIRYRNPGLSLYVKRGDLQSISNMSALCHWHEDVELLMPREGYLNYNIDGEIVHIPEGSAVFVNARHMHYGFSADGTDCQYLCVTFRPQLLCTAEEIRSRYVLPILTSPGFSYLLLRREDPENAPVFDALKTLDTLYSTGAAGAEMVAMGQLFLIWNRIFLAAQTETADVNGTDQNVLILKRMLEFIRTHYSEKLTVDTIAASGGVCRTKCCRLFRQYLDRTPNEYLNSFRLEQGMELLKSTDLTVTEIAGLSGFSSPSYFTELFTARKGCPPKEFRKRL